MASYVTLPGINGSGPDHWQTLWEEADPSLARFQPGDWDAPCLADWSAALDRAVAAAPDPPILVAHSLACLLVVHWAMHAGASRVAGAFLVSVPDPKGSKFPAKGAPSFAAELPNTPLPFPAWIVASCDDPYGTIDHARQCSTVWQTSLVNVGCHGHINEESQLGLWPVGTLLLRAFAASLGSGPTAAARR